MTVRPAAALSLSLSLVSLLGCGQESASTDDGAGTRDPDGLTLIHPTWGIGAESLSDLVANDVTFVGTVTGASDGPEALTNEPGARDNERRRLVTVRVDSVLAGDTSVTSVQLYTFGWSIPDGPDGKAIPITPAGVPWLDVGERVFISANQGVEGEYEVYTPPGEDGAFEIVDGRLTEPYGGSDSPVWDEITGLSVDEVTAKVRAIEG